jgi:hypothetical protein
MLSSNTQTQYSFTSVVTLTRSGLRDWWGMLWLQQMANNRPSVTLNGQGGLAGSSHGGNDCRDSRHDVSCNSRGTPRVSTRDRESKT